ncbi:gamma-glutamylcyclotransferase family protein [Falsiroseomonas sp.]|uniref:gamma-glutamylcyclotransferase family protein n=1 Tax=Falsiroseomonas sp. TaxID=2870721 RepID=UPI00271E4D7A|nr:gamma-glutamylcyclotransferase family protein [Falsiroseomonas sp.]MDO9503140.1 gamma-glutamylcyclotransferase family protein [Falsiroseomonas sp.]
MPATEGAAVEVFLYGTLLDPAVLAARSGRRFPPRAWRPALLAGWRRVMLRRQPYPTLRRARGGRVAGVLIRVCGAPLRRLMAYEGAAYRLRPVRPCRPGRGPALAMAWIAHILLAEC